MPPSPYSSSSRRNNNDSVDPLLSRFNLEEEIVFDNQQVDPLAQQQTTIGNNNSAPLDQLLGTIGGLLDTADSTLEDLHSNNPQLLGSAIVRTCQELADAVGHMANHLEQQSQEDRQALAQACLEDAAAASRHEQQLRQQSSLQQHSPNDCQLVAASSTSSSTELTAQDIVTALDGASCLLRDVEVGLRGIERDEADEIADVALTLARLFVASLQSFHATVVQQEEERHQERRRVEAERFEILEDDDNDHDNENEGGKTSDKSTATHPNNNNNKNNHKKKQRIDRQRVLWPPLGPAVASACNWGKDEAIQRPILAVALGMTLWPAAVMTAFLGAPLVIADTVVQHTYNTFSEGPIVSNMEKSAAQLLQAGKLSLLCTKLVTKQTLRVAHRQLERQGGVVPIAQNLIGMAVDRALHPVETVAAVWDGVQWAVGMVQQHLHQHNNQNSDNDNHGDATPAMADEWQ